MLYLTIIGGAFLTWLILVVLFTPHIPYHIEGDLDVCSDHFIDVLESTCLARLQDGNTIDIFTDGPAFYPAMLEAIRGARETVNLECYIFRTSDIGDQFIEALSERARAGVRVTVVIDAIGGMGSLRRTARLLRESGCRVEPYQRLAWYRLARLNNRTHRELLVVDARVAFVGGAGIANTWIESTKGKPLWRDMMARFEGPVVSDIQGIVAENWLECCGEILTGVETYKPRAQHGSSAALAIKSSPADRATVSRVLIQMLIEGANRSVLISTPYFLPDRAFRRAIVRAARRGVEFSVVLPGSHTDQRMVRLASRSLYGELLEAGVRIFEYRPGMTHVKTLIVDGLWSVIGTTNIDNRSFEHNDEVNVVIRDLAIAARLRADFEADKAVSDEVSLERWRSRSPIERMLSMGAGVLERQQ